MVVFLKFRSFFCAKESKRLRSLNPFTTSSRFCHFESKPGFNPLDPSLSLAPKIAQNNVAIFWDLDNKPPKSFPPYDAAVKLKVAASSLGVVRYAVAYANHHPFSYVPQVVREQRKERKVLNQLENRGVIKANEPHLCRVCGRKFYTNEKLVNHFKQIHEREQMKRVNQIESARGMKRVKLVGKYSMKMQKYKNAVRDVLNTKVGFGLADELKRAGFLVWSVSDKPQAVDGALKNHMVDMMDRRRAECMVFVSDDSDFVDVLKEAKLRCLKTVVVGDMNDGALKRVADASFSWTEILMGKAKKEAVSVVGKWRDCDVLKRLEWTYNPEVEKEIYDYEDEVVEDSEDDCEGIVSGVVDDNVHEEDIG
ncbi:hypothetical protein FH972_012804 [Carpinus fangiana]|uniref:C2H2-type domain-containing protein n=1 Tax=Carpinus fangiana TaxID=176857 RepID=A0A5N6R5U9_9ROSI|nr:hypothetical protein FH972_012804 [Carpinus fangiana]